MDTPEPPLAPHQLVLTFLPLIHAAVAQAARRFSVRTQDLATQRDDAFQEAALVALDVAHRYDPARASFATLAAIRMGGHLKDWSERNVRFARVHAPVPVVLDADGDEVDVEFEDLNCDTATEALGGNVRRETVKAVVSFVATLTAREQYIIRRVFYEDATQAMVARELSVSKMAVTKTLQRVYAKGRVALSPVHDAQLAA